MTAERVAHGSVVRVEQEAPTVIAERRGLLGRCDDVREEHGREDPVDLEVRALAGEELQSRVGDGVAQDKLLQDIAAPASYGHGSDFSWISGEVQLWRKDIRMRYASLDEADQFGGSLSLVGEEHLEQLKDGDQLKLIGHVVIHDAKRGGPAYYVEGMQRIAK